MDEIRITLAATQQESGELDRLLWDVLWQPVGFPRNVRDSFKLDGKGLEFVALAGDEMVGGLVANWTSQTQVEIRHIAVVPDWQHQGVGRQLVTTLIAEVSAEACSLVHTIARNTSVIFFEKLGFAKLPGGPLEHPEFSKHGISFEKMERVSSTHSRNAT